MFQNFKDSRKMANSLKGIFSVYKEKGMTSVDVLRFLRLQIEDDLGLNTKMYGVRFGHGGILDQSSCGVLDHVTKEIFEGAIKQFEGSSLQKQPPHGAMNLDRIGFSDLIGNEVDVSPEPRNVHCHSICCKEFNPPYFSLDIHCSGGFFVRSFIHDLGLALGSFAHMLELERTQHGPFTIKDALHQYQWSYAEVMEAITKADQMCKEYFIKKIR
ncbi:pseudouridylate synthase TRUB1-like isoform X2 [Tachypleus tridentatus]|uniref:pseudouridylate synthase TRUB1-like isoform X2 n=1 Tax=Tachypleus tridentatus TaxID=6853 RepID=UPI003FD2DD3D